MAQYGLIPARGPWEYRWFATTSAATFKKGALVNLDDTFLIREYLSTDSQCLGIAMSNSTASTPVVGGANSVLVAIPAPRCTAYSDITTGVAASSISVGQASVIYKVGNIMSFASTVMGEASRFSALVTIAGPVQADTSQIEVAFNALTQVLYSTSSATALT